MVHKATVEIINVWILWLYIPWQRKDLEARPRRRHHHASSYPFRGAYPQRFDFYRRGLFHEATPARTVLIGR